MSWWERVLPAILVGLLAYSLSRIPIAPGEEIDVTVTAYSPGRQLDGVVSNSVTATGTPTTSRGIAADWSQFPAGTKIEVPGYGVAIVDDRCGAARKAHRDGATPIIDIRLPTAADAVRWGRQHLRVRVRVVTP